MSAARRLVLLVATAVFINYIDRGNLATAAPLLQDELHLTPAQLGILLSAFYYGYVPCMPATGWLAERFGAHRVLGAGIAVWSVATLLTGFASGFAVLLALRVLLGVGESVAFPCASKMLASTVAVGRLGVANGVVSFGYLFGPAVGTFVGGYLMSVFGWRAVFVGFGALSLAWLWPWRRAAVPPAPRVAVAAAGARPPPLRRILAQRALWGACCGHFASNYVYYFILSWLPYYLVKARGFSITGMAAIAAWAYLLNAVSALAMGWAADRWIRAGRSPTLVYKSIMGVTCTAGIGCMAGVLLLPQNASVAMLFLFEIISGCSYPGLFAIAQILAGASATGSWVGVQNAAGNVAGLIAPALTGFLVGSTGRFDLAFALAAVVNVLGFVGWVVMVPQIRPIAWTAGRPRPAAATGAVS